MYPCLSPNGQTSFELDRPPMQLLVGTANGIVQLVRDGVAAAWREAGRSLPGKHIGALINAPGGRLFAGCHNKGGLFRSVDGSATWEPIGGRIDATDIFSLAVLDTPEGPAILAGTEPVNLFRSGDFGDSWAELPAITRLPGAENWTFPPPPHIPHLKAMTIDRSAPNRFYACVEQGALLRTDDGGLSWTELDAMWSSADEVYKDAHRIVTAPWDPELLVLTSGLGPFRSTDRGATWTRIDDIARFTKYPDVVVASPSDHAIYIGGPADYPVDWLAGDASGTICRSTDDGLSWQVIDHGLPKVRANIEGLSIVTYPGGYMLFAGDTDGRIFASDDRGEIWNEIAVTGAISKGAHFRIAQLSSRLPRWAGAGATMIFDKVTRFTGRRAGNRRRAAFANRIAENERLIGR